MGYPAAEIQRELDRRFKHILKQSLEVRETVAEVTKKDEKSAPEEGGEKQSAAEPVHDVDDDDDGDSPVELDAKKTCLVEPVTGNKHPADKARQLYSFTNQKECVHAPALESQPWCRESATRASRGRGHFRAVNLAPHKVTPAPPYLKLIPSGAPSVEPRASQESVWAPWSCRLPLSLIHI
eukprot:2604194-Rhodomonas_salina.1